MSQKSVIISGLIAAAAPKIAVVFSGDVPRLIGVLDTAPSAEAVKGPVDTMLHSQGLSATFISRAYCHDKLFVAAHG